MSIYGTLGGQDSTSTGYPSIRPTLDLNFAQTKALDPRVTFYRESLATYVDSLGLIRTVPANVPRFDHDPATGESLGLLIEESRTNLLVYSTALNTSAFWSTANLTVSSTTDTTSPDGTNNAWKLTEDSTNNFRYIAFGVTMGATPHTASVWMKAGTRTQGSIFLTQGGNTGATFTLTGSGSFSAFGTGNSASIIPYPNGWYRCTVTNNGSADINDSIRIGIQNGANQAYQGDGSSAIYVWGAQLEAGSFPTSYIPTSATTVTRSADFAYMDGTNFSSWYNSLEGTAFIDVTPTSINATDAFQVYFNMNSSTSNRWGVSHQNSTRGSYSSNSILPYTGAGGAFDIINHGGFVAGTKYKICMHQPNGINMNSSINGGSVSTVSTSRNPSVNQLFLGRAISDNGNLIGYISRFMYYPKRLTNAQLQNLTAL